MGAKVDVEGRDEARREVVLRGPNGDPRRERRQRLVADVVVDNVGRLPEALDVDPGVATEPVQRLDQRLARDPVEREGERVHRRRDDVRADPRRDERVRERRAAGGLDVEADRQPARLREPLDELLRDVREERAGRVVQEDARGAELAEALRLLDERVGLAGTARAVDEPDMELATGAHDRLPRLAEVGDVVERVVQAEDVDAVLGRARDEAPDDVGRDRLRADEETAAERDPERCRRPCVDRADPLPRALDAAAHRASKTPPPETSRHAKPAPSRISAMRRTSPVGIRPASGSCESSRIVVSTSCGTADLTREQRSAAAFLPLDPPRRSLRRRFAARPRSVRQAREM